MGDGTRGECCLLETLVDQYAGYDLLVSRNNNHRPTSRTKSFQVVSKVIVVRGETEWEYKRGGREERSILNLIQRQIFSLLPLLKLQHTLFNHGECESHVTSYYHSATFYYPSLRSTSILSHRR